MSRPLHIAIVTCNAKKMNITSILYKLKFEQAITDSEREFIKSKLFNYRSDDELNQAIRAFGFAYPPSEENVKIVEKFLQYKATELGFDDIIRASALNVLCKQWWWGLAKEYLPLLKTYALMNSDDYSETQIATFSILGEYIYNSKDYETLKFVYELFEKRLLQYEEGTDDNTLNGIYKCLNVAMYGPVALVDNYHISSPKDINQNLIDQIHKSVLQL